MKYTFNGKNYKTLTSCYNDNVEKITVGIVTVRSRLKDGWSLEDALLKPKQKTGAIQLGEHIVEGKVYESLSSVRKEYGISSVAIYKRYSRGCRGDNLVPPNKRKKKIETPIQEKEYGFYAGGVGYSSASSACRELGVKYGTFHSRLSKGLSVEQALGIETVVDGRKTKEKIYEVNGRREKLDDLSQKYNVPISTVRDRLRSGASIRQALNLEEIPEGFLTKKRKRKAIRLEVDGEVFTSYKSLADRYGLPSHTVRQRIVNAGYSAEDAVKAKGKNKSVVVDGVSYNSITDVAEAFGLRANVLYARLERGSTLREALYLDIKETTRTLDYQGKTYKSLIELAEEKDISIAALRMRIIRGMSLEEAMGAGDHILNVGRYNLTILERDEDLAGKPAQIYFVSIAIDGKRLFKVGITTQTVEIRLSQEQYKFEIIKTVEGTLKNCFLLEKEIHSLLAHKRDLEVTSNMLDGYSEVFTLNDDEVLLINEMLDQPFTV